MNLLFKNILFTIIIPGTVGVYLPIWLGQSYPGPTGWWNWVGLLPLVFGLLILMTSIQDFGSKGKGTPFPLDPPQNLVTGNLYQYSRNPMYVGVLSVIAGWSIWYSSLPILFYGLVVCLIFNGFVRLVEEPFLQRTFGEAYAQYCQRVRRWF